MSTPLRVILRLALCLSLSTLFRVGAAQQYILIDREPFITAAEATHLMQSLDTLVSQLDLDANLHPVQLFDVDNTIYAIADGHSYLWKWERDSFRNMYPGYYHGYNFGGYHFAYRGHIYSYGGYGYWQFMPFLTYFDWETSGLSTVLFYKPNRAFRPRGSLWLGLPVFLLFGAAFWWYRRRLITINQEPPTDFPYPAL